MNPDKTEERKLVEALEATLTQAVTIKARLRKIQGPPKVYYFGCAKPFASDGHQLYWRPFYSLSRTEMVTNKVPWTLADLDGSLAPIKNPWTNDSYKRQECSQGITSVTYKNGWTALSFWDRTGDERGASNSSFLIDRIVDFKEGIELAQASWPQLFKRFQGAGLELKEYEPRT